MKLRNFVIIALLLVFTAGSFATMTYDGAYYKKNVNNALNGTSHDPIYLALNEMATYLNTGFSGSSGVTVTGGVANINASSNYAINLGTGTTTGTVSIGGTAAQTIAVGSGGTASSAKVVTVGSNTGASSVAVTAGTGDISITSVDDISILGGSAGSIINIGTNVQGNVFNIGTDNSAADTINLGSALDSFALNSSGMDVTTTGAVSGVTTVIASVGVQSTATGVTATTGGATTGLIPANASVIVVTSDSADKQITLPAPAIGMQMTIIVGATGCELIATGSAVKINDVVCSATNEAALAADRHYVVTCVSATEWILVGYTHLGAVDTAIVPDTL